MPTNYCFIDEYIELEDNTYTYVYGKSIVDKNYYVTGCGFHRYNFTKIDEFNKIPVFNSINEVNEYKKQIFGKKEDMDEITKGKESTFKYLLNISKSDYSKYEPGEPIILMYEVIKDDVVEKINVKFYPKTYL